MRSETWVTLFTGDMGNTILALSRWRRDALVGVLRRNWVEFHCLFVEETEIQVHKIDTPDAVLFLFKADSLTEIDLIALAAPVNS